MISVIVCTYNRPQALRRMLSSFFQQDGLDGVEYELIVVDNNSNEPTRSVFDEFAHHRTVRYVFEGRQGLSVARNRGVDTAKGEIAAFLDDDVEVDRNWLRNMQNCFEETDADVVGGRSYLVFEKEPPDWLGPLFRVFLSEVDFGDRRQLFSDGTGLWGVNLSLRKSAFEAGGGFDESLGRKGSQLLAREDTVLLKKIGSLKKSIVYEPKVVVGHIIGPERLEWDYFIRHAIGMGRTMDLTEAPRTGLWQFLRVGKATLVYSSAVLKSIWIRLYGSSEYEKKRAEWISRSQKSHLVARWERLWNRLSGSGSV